MENPKLSTMVVLYTLNKKFDTTKLLETLPLNDSIIKVEKRGILTRGTSSRDKIKRRPKNPQTVSKTGFGHNSITVVVLTNVNGSLPLKEITVKIFQNGVFHFTGVLHDDYDKYVMELLSSTIRESCRECILNENDDIQILNRRIVLINYTSEMSKKGIVAREALVRTIKSFKDSDITVSYDPDVYPGVKIRFLNDRWTANIFRTGKIILTGLTSELECIQFRKKLENLFEKTVV